MKNTLLTILFIFAAGHLCYYGLPWWAITLAAAVPGWVFRQSPARSFLAGFTGGFLLWLTAALLADVANGGILSARIGALFMGAPASGLAFGTGILGGLLAGLGCLTGRWASDLVGQPAKAR